MRTIHLSDEEVAAYLRDLEHRFPEAEKPDLWITIGASGTIIGKRLAEAARDWQHDELILTFNRATGRVGFPDAEGDLHALIGGKRTLLIDGAVHTGGTLLRALREIRRFLPKSVSSYAVAVRRSANVIPNNFGFLIGDHDRVHFPSRALANNRLCSSGTYRKLTDEDCSRPMISTGADFIDRVAWEDRSYELHTNPNRHVYVHETEESISSFISFKVEGKILFVDEVGADKNYRGLGLGGHLMRWAEHYARNSECADVELMAVDNKVDWYEKLGFQRVHSRPLTLSGHQFFRMRKKLLYHLPEDDNEAMGL